MRPLWFCSPIQMEYLVDTFVFTILPTESLAVTIIINQEDNRDNVLMTAQANYKTSEIPLRVLFYQMLIMLK